MDRRPEILREASDELNGSVLRRSLVENIRGTARDLSKAFLNQDITVIYSSGRDVNFSIIVGKRFTKMKGIPYQVVGFESKGINRHLVIPDDGDPLIWEGKIDSILFPYSVNGARASLADLRDFSALTKIVVDAQEGRVTVA